MTLENPPKRGQVMEDRGPPRGREPPRDPAPRPLPRERTPPPMPDPTSPTPLHRFFGGSPARVALQLVLISIAVGLVLSTLNIEPLSLLRWLQQTVRELLDYMRWAGIDLVESLGRWLLLGAVVVVPVWLVMRLVKVRQGR